MQTLRIIYLFVAAAFISIANGVVIPCNRDNINGVVFCEVPPTVFRIRIIAVGAKGGPVASCNGGPCAEQGGTAIEGGVPGQVIVELEVFPGQLFNGWLGQQGGQDTTVAGRGGRGSFPDTSAVEGVYPDASVYGGDGSCINCAAASGGSSGCAGNFSLNF